MPDGRRCGVGYVWACCLKLCLKAAEQCRAETGSQPFLKPGAAQGGEHEARVRTACHMLLPTKHKQTSQILLAPFGEIDFGNLTALGVVM